MLDLITSSSLLQLLKSTILFKSKSERHGFLELKEESGTIGSLVEHHPEKSLINWQNVTSKLPYNIVSFSKCPPLGSLSSGKNLQKLKQYFSPNCLLCNKK